MAIRRGGNPDRRGSVVLEALNVPVVVEAECMAAVLMGSGQELSLLKSEGATRTSRLALCDATARVLKQGLGLLGIEAPERM